MPQTNAVKNNLKKAEEYEFKHKNFRRAIRAYDELLLQAKDNNFKAQMRNNIARCCTKLKDYKQAISNYTLICEKYPKSLSSSGLPLCLIARVEILNGYQSLGKTENSLRNSLELYRDILHQTWNLNENQFKTYSSMINEAAREALSKTERNHSFEGDRRELARLEEIHQEKLRQWRIINDLKNEIIPELQRRIPPPKPYEPIPYQHSKKIGQKNFLTLAVSVPDQDRKSSLGFLGLKIKEDHLKNDVLKNLIEDTQLSESSSVTISDLTGRIILGKENPSPELLTVTEFFENNFPPWKIEFFRAKTKSLGIVDIRKSFYFWTILTLVIILIFGTALIMRTIAHEMEVLKIKSDFVSSVSHEFKTPLTSIKALVERLQSGKVSEAIKMDQYFSVISQDAEKLTRLVNNILDFSKIEEGKKEYELVETNLAPLITQQIEAFQKDIIKESIKIRVHIEKDIPSLAIDKVAVSQAINNLLDNAVKFSPEGKDIQVNVTKDKDSVIIEIIDEGIGIPHDEFDKIFDKFYQASNALKQSVKGTGLGLTLVKHTVEAHKGKIAVKSEIGHGTAFSLIFPLKRKGV
jgi:signal transduction histidine kinase